MSSSPWYFYLEKGKTTGPFAKTDIEDAISRGKLGPFDLIYRDGEEKWHPLHQVQDFKALFKSQIKAEIDESWVVLSRRESESGVSYLQRGPFATERVKSMLLAGEIRYRDFIWREGQAQWSRISTIDLFAPPPVAWTPQVNLPQDVDIQDLRSKAEILSEVVASQRPPVLPVDTKPKEANTEDLSQKPAHMTIEKYVERRKVPRSKLRPAPTLPLNRARFPDEKSAFFELPKPRRLPLLRVMAGLVSVGLIAFLYFSRHEILRFAGIESKQDEGETLSKTKPKIKDTPRAVAPEARPVAAPAPVVPPPAPEPEIPRTEPTRIKAVVVDASSKPAVIFETDGSYHFPIRVLILGQAGDVLGQVSSYREVTVRRQRDAVARLELTSLELGEGRYELLAQMKDVKSEIKFRLGRDDRDFRGKLERHRKLISLPFQRERRRLIRASRELQDLGSRFRQLIAAPDAAWKEGIRRFNESLSTWSKTQLDGLNVSNPRALVFPRAWQDLVEVQNELKQLSQEADKKRRAGAPVASSEVKQLTDRLRILAEQSQSVSLYR